ncbi:MAG: hypothetical protein H0W77_10970, partial [Acidobacteria bacterium]|nr:hypothetical protein [Acidobacteriota bacterium]
TAEGFIRRTSSGKKSCAETVREPAEARIKKAKNFRMANFIAGFLYFLLGIIKVLSKSNKLGKL